MSQREEFEEWHKEKHKAMWKLKQDQDDLFFIALGWKAWQAAQAKQAAEIKELKYINERLQKHCSETTEQLNIALGKCASLEKANAAYRALEKKRDAMAGGEL